MYRGNGSKAAAYGIIATDHENVPRGRWKPLERSAARQHPNPMTLSATGSGLSTWFVLAACVACGESVIVARELRADAGSGPECSSEMVSLPSAPAALEWIVDTSGSMNDDAPGGRGTKWTAMREALLHTIDELPEQVALGVVFFPDLPGDAAQCFDRVADVRVDELGAADSSQRRQINEAFQAQMPEGGAPTHDAYNFAFGQLQISGAMGRRFLVLITDEYPTVALNCRRKDPVELSPLIGAAAFARDNGVSTFVVALPARDEGRSNLDSEEARSSLSRMAQAGGTAPLDCSHDGPRYCHFDMTDEQDFDDAITGVLGAITAQAVGCNYALPVADSGGALIDPDKVNVQLSPLEGPAESIARSPSDSCDEGWRYAEGGSRIVLCGGTCERVRASGGSVTLQFGCATQSR